MPRSLALLVVACLLLLGCGEHLAGTHDEEVFFNVEGRVKEPAPPKPGATSKPQTLAEAAAIPVNIRLGAMHITADVQPAGDDVLRVVMDKDEIGAAEAALKWPGGIEIDELDPEIVVDFKERQGLTEKTETHPGGVTEHYWEGERTDVARAITATKAPDGHRLVAESYDSLRGRTRVVRSPALADLSDGIDRVQKANGGKGISIVLKADAIPKLDEASRKAAGAPLAVVRAQSALAVRPIAEKTKTIEVGFGDDIYSYTRAHTTRQLLSTPPVPPLKRGESKTLAPDWPVAIASIALPIVMSLAWLFFVRRFDRAQPEPMWLVLATFALGGLSVIPAGFAEYFLMSRSPYLNPEVMTLGGQIVGLLPALVTFTVVVGISEEGSKFLGTWSLAYHRREFDEPVDGMVYGAASALGFAAVENIKYFAVGRLAGTLVAARAFMSVPGHMFFGALWGYALGQKLVRKKTPVWLYFLGAATLHGAFDTLLSIDGLALGAVAINILLASLFVIFLRRSLRHGMVTTKEGEAVPSAQRQLFPMGSPLAFIIYAIALHVLAVFLFGTGIYYEVEHHRIGGFFIGISASLLFLVGLSANGLAQAIPLDVAVDAVGVTFAGAARKWEDLVAVERLSRWGVFGPRSLVKIKSKQGDLLVGPGNARIVEQLVASLQTWIAARPKA